MQVSTSAYYAWIKQPEMTDKKKQEKVLEAKVSEFFYDHKQVYGLKCHHHLHDLIGDIRIGTNYR